MQIIHLDISNKGVIPCIQAKQSEVGRKFLAIITDNGMPYNIPDNSLLSVWYEGETDAGNYSSVEDKSAFVVDGNKVTVELVAQMLLKPGNGELCLSITHGDGGETNTWNISYCVEYKPGAGSTVPTEYYTALTEAGAVAAENARKAKYYSEIAEDSVNNVLLNNRVLVWQNEFPDSDFDEQTIDVELSPYSRIEVVDTNGSVHIFAITNGSIARMSTSYVGSTGNIEVWSRGIRVLVGEISFDKCWMAYFRNNAWSCELSNMRLVPAYIYGIIK